MEFLQLRYFYESAKNKSFAVTAKNHMVPTSSVSASVKRLENEIGTKLFDRSSNRITLNEKGFVFFATVEEIFNKLNETVSSITENSNQNPTIKILIKARRKWITELIIQYKKQFPHVRFEISHDALISKSEPFDIVIDEHTDQYLDKDSFLLSVEELCIKTSKNNPLANRMLTFKDLKNFAFLVSQKGSRMWQVLEKHSSKNGFIPNISLESNDRMCLIRYTEAGMGLLLGSKSALRDETEKNLTALNVVDFSETQAVHVYYNPERMKDISVKSFLSFLKTTTQ
jgi:DNA-binding transcriptional LysR family regulator